MIGYIFFGVVFMFAGSVLIATRWYDRTYAIELRVLIYTLSGPMDGAGTGTTRQVLESLLPPIAGLLALYVAGAFLLSENRWNAWLWQKLGARRFRHRTFPQKLRTRLRRACALACALMVPVSGAYAESKLQILEFLAAHNKETWIYEAEYVETRDVAIVPPEKPRNLICIVVESLETAYMSREQGGYQEVNLIPQLTQIAEENLYFSGTKNFSGMNHVQGTQWTIAALLAATTGVPYAFPVESGEGHEDIFGPGLTTLGDLLDEQGYRQEFLCGSDASFAGRRAYFQKHGNYFICDLLAAREVGRIPQDYNVWWGFEDRVLFQIAREEASTLAAGEQPFNLTLLTADLHHIDGYVCPDCPTTYAEKTANVAACTDNQVASFVRWCQEQPFYEDTVILIYGDHPRMDTSLVENAVNEERTTYHCFLNAVATPQEGAAEQRVFTAMDLFPTTLAAMGYQIDGERLGLGTNLFSGTPTLPERIGLEKLHKEMNKKSRFYLEHFYEEE